MKFLYSIILIISSSFFTLNLFKSGISPDRASGQESPRERLEWEQSKTADPSTGKIPSMGIWNAYNLLVTQGKIVSQPFMMKENLRNGEWSLVNDFFASIAISKITYDPNNTQTFYFCTGEGWYGVGMAVGAGVFKSTDGGNTWNQLSSTANSDFDWCYDVDVHPTTSDVYVGTLSGGLMRSKDGGATWQCVLYPSGNLNHAVCDVELTKNGGIFAATGVFQTGGIYYSDNGDSGTWVKQTNGFPSTGIYRVELATAPSNDNVAYAVACNNTDYAIKGIYKTIDKGNTWTTLPFPGGDDTLFAHFQAWYDIILAVDPNDENVVAGGGWKFWRSKDGGNTWQQISHGNPDSSGYQYVHVDEHEILFRNSDTVYFGTDGGVYKCGNFTSDFPEIYERNYGYRVTQYYTGEVHPAAGNVFIAGGTQDNGTNSMGFGGISPNHQLTGYDGGVTIINPQSPNIIYTNKNQLGTFRYTNSGFDIADTITNPYLVGNNVQWINPMVMDKADPEILYMGSSKGLWRLKNASTADKSEWVQASLQAGAMTALAISKSQPHTVFSGRQTGGNIYRLENANTTDASAAWIDCDPDDQLPNSSGVFCACVYADPLDVNHVFAVYSNYGVKNIWESKNATTSSPTWVSHDGDLPDLPVQWIFPHPTHPEVCYVATDLGVFYTTQLNEDNTVWLPMNEGLANVRVSMLTYKESDQTLLAASYGRGMFIGIVPLDGPDFSIQWTERGPLDVGGRTRAIMIDPNDLTGQTIWAGAVSGGLWKTTGIDGIPAVGVAPVESDVLSLNIFPNPASSDGAEIQFLIPASQSVSVIIYDSQGKKVQTLLQNQKQNAGIHKMHWSFRKSEPGGIYYVTLTCDGKKLIRKLLRL